MTKFLYFILCFYSLLFWAILTHSSGGNKHVSGFSHTCVENAKHLQTYNCVAFCTHVCLFPYLCVKIQTCVENSTQVKIYQRVWFFPNMLGKSQTSAKMNMCGILHTGLAFLKHICKKSNMCGKNYHVALNIPLSFFDGNKDLAHFSTILFDLLSLS